MGDRVDMTVDEVVAIGDESFLEGSRVALEILLDPTNYGLILRGRQMRKIARALLADVLAKQTAAAPFTAPTTAAGNVAPRFGVGE